MRRRDAEAALAYTLGRGREAALFAKRCLEDDSSCGCKGCRGAAAVVAKLQRLDISAPACVQNAVARYARASAFVTAPLQPVKA